MLSDGLVKIILKTPCFHLHLISLGVNSTGKTEISQLTPKRSGVQLDPLESRYSFSWFPYCSRQIMILILLLYRAQLISPPYTSSTSLAGMLGMADLCFHLLPSLLLTKLHLCDPTQPAFGPATQPGRQSWGQRGVLCMLASTSAALPAADPVP